MGSTERNTILLITQVFVPDTPSVGQHLGDLADGLAAAGYRVRVLAPRGGYEDPAARFPQRESRDGVEIRRLAGCSFGKTPLILRLLGGLSLALQGLLRGLFTRGLRCVVVSTAPPVAGLAARGIALFRRVGVVFWVMDLNPDQMIAAGRLAPGSLAARLGERVNRVTLGRADRVVALDEEMAERLRGKSAIDGKLAIIPPWPYDDQLADIPHPANPFRAAHGLDGRFVVMYSGNITPVHPIDTLLQAMIRLKEDEGLLFLFIGPRDGRRLVEEHARHHSLPNVRTMDYVPLAETRHSLSAADVHLVTMGEAMVGVVHPCKVYGILSVGRPFLAVAPRRSHIGRMVERDPVGWRVEHGDVDGVVEALAAARGLSDGQRQAMGARARRVVAARYARTVLCGQFVRQVEAAIAERR